MKKSIIILAVVLGAWGLPACNTAEHKANNATEQTQDSIFQPTGDLEKDAQTIADMTIQSSQRMLDGEASPDEEQTRADQIIKVYNDYYQKQNRGEEFQKALTAATEVAVDSLGVILGKGQR